MWRESSFFAQIVLLLAACVGFAALVKFIDGALASATLTTEQITTFSDLLKVCGLIVGGLVAYLRFFKGRLFSPKILLKLNSGAMAGTQANTHWLNIEIQNTGSVSLWSYDVSIKVVPLETKLEAHKEIPVFSIEIERDSVERLVDVAESSFEHTIIEMPHDISVFTFVVEVRDKRGTTWRQFKTVSNSC